MGSPDMQQQNFDFASSFLPAFYAGRQQNALAQPQGFNALATPSREYNALATFGGPTNTARNALSGDDPIARGILETAQAGGLDPIDLATAISYETAGTFDPRKKGPTTQWGQHEGLIQWGEPQAKQYGVNWDDPVGSQLGAEGAVLRYLRDRGVKPGMGLLDIYSAINAGGVGLYDRSDANNGGAPGTVRDKVMNQMEGHRRKAEALLGPYLSNPVQREPVAAPPSSFEQRGRAPAGRFDVSSFLQYL